MKSRSKELLDRAIAATVASIEIYNKPDFLYREEAFAVLALNGWELLLKAKWLSDNGNRVRSLYVLERVVLKKGGRGKQMRIKPTRSGNPFTHNIDFLAHKLVEQGRLDPTVLKNLEALLEVRDSAIHFYNRAGKFSLRLQEIGTASLKNFVTICRSWFGRDLSEFNFYLMPLSFVSIPKSSEALVLNTEEKNFLTFLNELERNETSTGSDYAVSVNVELRFIRSKAKDALNVRLSADPNATQIRLTEEQIRDRYPWDYKRLSQTCRGRYSDFKENKRYHDIRNKCLNDERFAAVRFLDPGNPRSTRKTFFNPAILSAFDSYYVRKSPPSAVEADE
jgi:hypothetical protein